jgi:hypothetical protein
MKAYPNFASEILIFFLDVFLLIFLGSVQVFTKVIRFLLECYGEVWHSLRRSP